MLQINRIIISGIIEKIYNPFKKENNYAFDLKVNLNNEQKTIKIIQTQIKNKITINSEVLIEGHINILNNRLVIIADNITTMKEG